MDKELHEDNKEQETLTPEQQEIKEMITQTLNDHMKKLKVGICLLYAWSNHLNIWSKNRYSIYCLMLYIVYVFVLRLQHSIH